MEDIYIMAQYNTFAGTLDGLFKEVYADSIKDLIPDGLKLLSKISFSKQDQSLGNLYH